MTTYEFEVAAKNLIIEHNVIMYDHKYSVEDISLVWFSKTLKNMKAILIDNGQNGYIYEVTYNGEKEEFYLDHYQKIANKRISKEDVKFQV